MSRWLKPIGRLGNRIVEEEPQGEKRAGYGEGLMKELSKAFSTEFGKGFSVANLENFRKFYLTFPEDQISYALRRELTWTHYRLIMRLDNLKAREYYINECADQMWSSRSLNAILTHSITSACSLRKKRGTCNIVTQSKIRNDAV
jgi:hypothetical protein